MYHNILVPISFDPERDVTAPLKLAQILATPDAKITLLHVVEQVPSYAISYLPTEYMAQARAALQQELDGLAKTLPDQAVGQVIEGHSGRSILDWAEQNKPDLIIMASHRPGMQDLLLGSTASQVVRHAACAVHVVR
ncbi:universal stress protein [Pseudophaeobacter flagellatus]|uniref:universal stress protein n=1 Tax=Pseudophaeobacter flagellatus TaxID=2899119 RepID=UPI001E398635|nr:universal stress protein [Pseudophaeobacter flagellatus]MCD9148703.1 universal stress protein [Pseudophaeobacter flagellatus]